MKKKQGNAKSRGRQSIQKERCQLQNNQVPRPYSEAKPIADVIPSLMKKLGVEDKHWLSILEDDWSAVVGEAVAGHTRPGRFDKNTLFVFVDSSVWLNELSRYGKGKMLSNLQNRFGAAKVRSVALQIDPDGQ